MQVVCLGISAFLPCFSSSLRTNFCLWISHSSKYIITPPFLYNILEYLPLTFFYPGQSYSRSSSWFCVVRRIACFALLVCSFTALLRRCIRFFFGGILIILLFKLLYLLTSSRQNKQIIIEHYQLAGICRKICKYHIIWGARLHCSWIPQPPTSNTSFFLPAGLSYLLATPSLSVCNGVESAELYSGVFKSNGHPSHSAHLSANRLALLLLSDIADQINQTDTSSPPLLWSSECHTDCYDWWLQTLCF